MSNRTRKDLEKEYYDRATDGTRKAAEGAAEHHPLHVHFDDDSGSLSTVTFSDVPQDSADVIQVGGMLWLELRAKATGQDQSIQVQARYHPDGDWIDLVSTTSLTAGGGWTDFLDRVDDSQKNLLGYAEMRIRGKDDGDGSGTLEIEGGAT